MAVGVMRVRVGRAVCVDVLMGTDAIVSVRVVALEPGRVHVVVRVARPVVVCVLVRVPHVIVLMIPVRMVVNGAVLVRMRVAVRLVVNVIAHGDPISFR